MNKIIRRERDKWTDENDMTLGFIYAIRLVGARNKIYVGMSDDPYFRFHNHVNALKGNYHQCREMQNDYNKYGGEIQIEILEAAPLYGIRTYELYWQVKLKSYLPEIGYNGKDPLIVNQKTKKPTKRFLRLISDGADVSEELGIPHENNRMVAHGNNYLFNIFSQYDYIMDRRSYKYVSFHEECLKRVYG